MATVSVVNRRDFLKKGAAGGAALVIGFHLTSSAFGDQAKDQEETNHKRGATRCALLQKITAVYNGNSCHGTPQSSLREKNSTELHRGMSFTRHGRGTMNSFTDALISAAAADVAAHGIVDVGVSGVGFL